MGYNVTENVHRICLYNTVAARHQHAGRQQKRLYLHIDLNCFYAQVEQQSYDLFGVPVIVGGWRKENGTPRGIVATSSYEARAYGVKTGMSHYEASKLCPYLVPFQVHWNKYQAISRQLRRILRRYSPSVETYSSDESFLSLDHLKEAGRETLLQLGSALKNDIYGEVQLLASVGIAESKTYAKLASDLKKPDGLVVVRDEEDARRLLHPLPVGEVWGVGRKRREHLKEAGIQTIADAVREGPGIFRNLFGTFFGQMLWETVTGKDCAMVLEEPEHIPQDVSYMHTFSSWVSDPEQVRGELIKAVRQLCYRMRGYDRRAESFRGYIRFQDVTWQGSKFKFQTPGPTNLDDYVCAPCLEAAMPLVIRFLGEGHRIRGIGMSTQELTDSQQLELFFRESEKQIHLYQAIDQLCNSHGLEILKPAGILNAAPGKTHFLDRS
ncbi:MAG: DNA polymerase IV [Opitutales bacterium]|nr:DNA polymerase IV [Opitutales bacterium]